MKYYVLAIFLGLLSSGEAIQMNKQSSLVKAPQKLHLEKKDPINGPVPAPAAKNLNQQNKTAEGNASGNSTAPTLSQQNVTGNSTANLTSNNTSPISHIQISVKQQANATSKNKIEELAAMELALKQATEETHRKMLEAQGITTQDNSTASALTQTEQQSKLLLDLDNKHKQQQDQFMATIQAEEAKRDAELKENMMYERDLFMAEKDRKNQETLVQERAKELKMLQEEEAAQKVEAEKKEQEFLEAQAIQETKAAAAKRAAAKANLARIKRKHELERRNAEAKLKMLKIQQEAETENILQAQKEAALQLAQKK